MKHSGCVPVAVSGSPSSRCDQRRARHEQPLGRRVDEFGEAGQRVGGPERAVGAVRGEHRDQPVDVALGDGDGVLRQQLLDLDEILSSCGIGVILEDLTALHYKIDILCNADVGQRVAGHRDDVGEVALGDPAEVGFVDQVGGDDGRRAQHRSRQACPNRPA